MASKHGLLFAKFQSCNSKHGHGGSVLCAQSFKMRTLPFMQAMLFHVTRSEMVQHFPPKFSSMAGSKIRDNYFIPFFQVFKVFMHGCFVLFAFFYFLFFFLQQHSWLENKHKKNKKRANKQKMYVLNFATNNRKN